MQGCPCHLKKIYFLQLIMTRIFLPPEKLTSDTITITGDNARHLALVLRIQPGGQVVVFDGRGYKYECIVEAVHKKEVVAKLINKSPYCVESPLSVTLAQGLPRGEKMDLIVQKATELGVRRIIPLVTERSQVRHTHKRERWRKIARSASEQSGRDRIPDIEHPVELKEYLEQTITALAKGYIEDIKGVRLDPEACIILSEGSRERHLKDVLRDFTRDHHFTVLVGPEGGFAGEEIHAAVEKGFIEVSLGPRILRTETAPLAALSIIQYELGDMG